MERRGALALVTATLLWGATFLVTRDALAGIAPGALLLARFAIATIVLGAIVLIQRRRVDALTLTSGLACAPFIALCVFLQTSGLRETSAGSSAFLTCAGTLAAPFFAWAMLRQRPSRGVLIGMAMALAGSALLSWRVGRGLGNAELGTFAGAVSYAFQLVIVARVAPRVDPVALTAVQSLGVALCLLPVASPFAAWAAFTGGAAVSWRAAYLALGGTVVAPLLQVIAQRTLSTGRVALLFALEPLFALLFAATLGGERFLPHWWAGAALILGAVLVAEWSDVPEPPGRP